MTQSELHPSLAARVALQTELRLPHVGASRFDALVAERGLAHVASLSWKTQADDLAAVLDRAVTTGRSDGCGR